MGYSNDLKDEQWELIKDNFKFGNFDNRVVHKKRDLVNVVFYIRHSAKVQTWKAEVLSKFSFIFESETRDQGKSEKQIVALKRKVGQLTIKRQFL